MSSPGGPVNMFQFVSACSLPTLSGNFEMRVYRNSVGQDAIALVVRMSHGKKANNFIESTNGASACSPAYNVEDSKLNDNRVLLRVQDQCITSEIFGSIRCDCKQQLDASLSLLQNEAAKRLQHALSVSSTPVNETEIIGLVIYLLQEGRGIGIGAKVSAYALQDEGGLESSISTKGLDTVDANRALGLPDDSREYDAVPNILQDLGLLDSSERSIYLLTNNPRKVNLLEGLGVKLEGRIPCLVPAVSALAAAYLRSKAERMGHEIPSSVFNWTGLT